MPRHDIDLTPHPGAKRFDKSDKIVRYQVNPEANWGPGTKAKMVQNQTLSQGKGKRKSEEASGEVKRAKTDVDEGVKEEVEEEAAFNA